MYITIVDGYFISVGVLITYYICSIIERSGAKLLRVENVWEMAIIEHMFQTLPLTYVMLLCIMRLYLCSNDRQLACVRKKYEAIFQFCRTSCLAILCTLVFVFFFRMHIVCQCTYAPSIYIPRLGMKHFSSRITSETNPDTKWCICHNGRISVLIQAKQAQCNNVHIVLFANTLYPTHICNNKLCFSPV